jgi:hypothetical protein
MRGGNDGDAGGADSAGLNRLERTGNAELIENIYLGINRCFSHAVMEKQAKILGYVLRYNHKIGCLQ